MWPQDAVYIALCLKTAASIASNDKLTRKSPPNIHRNLTEVFRQAEGKMFGNFSLVLDNFTNFNLFTTC